jgi:hypothetical protein
MGEEEGRTGSAWKWGWRERGRVEVAQTKYTHVSKCKNDNRKNSYLWMSGKRLTKYQAIFL